MKNAASPATQHTMSPKLVGKWETEYLNTTFPLPALPHAGNGVKAKDDKYVHI